MSFVIDASAAVALHFLEDSEKFVEMEEHLASEGVAFTAPNFFQEVMESLRKGIRGGRTNLYEVDRWLALLDRYQIKPIAIHPCAASATWLIAQTLNISAYDAGYLAVAKTHALPIFTLDQAIIDKGPRIGVTVNPRKL